jgi:3,4-dihydroxy-2-butanone 4-phosphate synthase
MNENKIQLDSIEEAIEAIRRGEIIFVVDDEDRENEGDMICASDLVTPEIINFMTKEARGLICQSLTEERCNELGLGMMVGKILPHMKLLLRFLWIYLAKEIQLEFPHLTGPGPSKPLSIRIQGRVN